MKAYFQVPAVEPDVSARYYQTLGFEKFGDFFTDGKLVLKIAQRPQDRAGVCLLVQKLDQWVDKLPSTVKMQKISGGYVCMDPNGYKVYLKEDKGSAFPQRMNESFGVLGNFSGISIESVGLTQSAEFWRALGYEKTLFGDPEKGLVSLSAGNGIDITLMAMESCPHQFPTAGITYFNAGKNLEVIHRLRTLKIPLFEEITCFNDKNEVDNIILKDPYGLGFFVFND